MKTFRISLMTIFALALLALTLVGFTGDLPQWTMIEFEPGTTLEQAVASVSAYDLDLPGSGHYRWSYKVNRIYSLSSGTRYTGDFQAAREEHWRTVLEFLPGLVQGTRDGGSATPADLAQAEALYAKLKPNDSCWEHHNCPPFEVQSIEVIVSGDRLGRRIEQEQSAVARVVSHDNPVVRTNSFFLAILARLTPPQ